MWYIDYVNRYIGVCSVKSNANQMNNKFSYIGLTVITHKFNMQDVIMFETAIANLPNILLA
jgi:hypothetical protein